MKEENDDPVFKIALEYPVFKVMHFPYPLAPHINWQSVAETARQVGANFRAEFTDEGCTVTMEWPAEEAK